MGLNQTLDRLAKEREDKELKEKLKELAALTDGEIPQQVKDWAKDIFFQRMLKDINPGLSEEKIDAMIDRSVMIATKLFNKLYR